MRESIVRVLIRLLALAVGVVVGFFAGFNAVFSDVFGLKEMAGAILYVFVAYVVIGFAFGAIWRRTGWRWAGWVAAPGLLMVVFTLLDDPGRWVYVLSVAIAIAGGSIAGGWLGAKVVSSVLDRRAMRTGVKTSDR